MTRAARASWRFSYAGWDAGAARRRNPAPPELMGEWRIRGMRSAEILTLTWDKVDLKRSTAWVSADASKSGSARVVPLNSEALDVLNARPKGVNVFTRSTGAPVKQIDARILARAFAAAGVESFRSHDLRHTWASWHVQSGTPLFVLKELGGWKTLEMVKKYAYLAPEHLAQTQTRSCFGQSSPPRTIKKPLRLWRNDLISLMFIW